MNIMSNIGEWDMIDMFYIMLCSHEYEYVMHDMFWLVYDGNIL